MARERTRFRADGYVFKPGDRVRVSGDTDPLCEGLSNAELTGEVRCVKESPSNGDTADHIGVDWGRPVVWGVPLDRPLDYSNYSKHSNLPTRWHYSFHLILVGSVEDLVAQYVRKELSNESPIR